MGEWTRKDIDMLMYLLAKIAQYTRAGGNYLLELDSASLLSDAEDYARGLAFSRKESKQKEEREARERERARAEKEEARRERIRRTLENIGRPELYESIVGTDEKTL